MILEELVQEKLLCKFGFHKWKDLRKYECDKDRSCSVCNYKQTVIYGENGNSYFHIINFDWENILKKVSQ